MDDKLFVATGVVIYNDDGRPRFGGETLDPMDQRALAMFIKTVTERAFNAGKREAQHDIRKALGIRDFGGTLSLEK